MKTAHQMNADDTMFHLRQEMKNSAARYVGSNSGQVSQGTVPYSVQKAAQKVPVVLPRLRPLYWVASIMGKRREMVDAVQVVPEFIRTASEVSYSSGHAYDFFGVYVGHGGPKVANKCRDRMHMIIAEEVARRWEIMDSEFVCWDDTMVESFKRVDTEEVTKKEPMYDGVKRGLCETVGSTALVAVVGERIIVVANCRDSRAVLSRGGRTVILSCDHKPNRPDEMLRIEQAEGKVVEWDGDRMWSIPATSRSIGDDYLKPRMTCKPEVNVMERMDEDEFLILATDGLWDVVSNEMACKIVRDCLHHCSTPISSLRDQTPVDVAVLLTRIAMSRGSRDNISVVVVQFSSQMRK